MSRGKKASSPLSASMPRVVGPAREKSKIKFLKKSDFPLRQRIFYGDQQDAPLLLGTLISKAIDIPKEAEDYLTNYLLEAAFVKDWSETDTKTFASLFTDMDTPIGLRYYAAYDPDEKKIWDTKIEPILKEHGPGGLYYHREHQQMLNHYALLPWPSMREKLKKHNEEIKANPPINKSNLDHGNGEADSVLLYQNVRRRCQIWENKRRKDRIDAVEKIFIEHFPEDEVKNLIDLYREVLLRSCQEWQPLELLETKEMLDVVPWYEFGHEMAPFLVAKGHLNISKMQEVLDNDGPIIIKKYADPREGNGLLEIRFNALLEAFNLGLKKANLI